MHRSGISGSPDKGQTSCVSRDAPYIPAMPVAALPHRALIRLSGADRVAYLQGLISNDVQKAEDGTPIWAAFLTPQGKFLHDMFVAKDGDSLLLECERERRDDLLTRLKRFKLRSDVALEPDDTLRVFASWGGTQAEGSHAFEDPRLPEMGQRIWTGTFDTDSDLAAYDTHRIALSVPDGSRDIQVEKAILLENGFEELNGVDYEKGCYMGQELTARTHYRALIKKRLLPITFEGPTPSPGTDISQDGKNVGEVKSGVPGAALALMRLTALDGGAPITAGGTEVTVRIPSWVELPEKEDA